MKYFCTFLLLPVLLFSQEEVTERSSLTVKSLVVTGNLIVNGSIVQPLPDTDPDPDPNPGPNPEPANVHPVASFTYSPAKGDFPLTVYVTDTSTDSDGTIGSRLWNWGDAVITTGATSNHTYVTAGNYGITLTVYDDDLASSTTLPKLVEVTTPVVLLNPVAQFTTDVATGTSPLTVNVDATTSYDTDGTIADPSGYVWDFSTGSPTSGTGSTDSTTFTGAGIYTITLTVTDDDALTAVTSKQIEVAAAPVKPVASFTRTPTSGNAPLQVFVNATGSTDPDGTITSYAWNWGDTTSGTGSTTSHTYTSSGTYDITLTVTDNSALTDVTSLQVQVYTGGLPPYSITTLASDYRSGELSWTDDVTWSYPWIIQRSTTVNFVDPTDLTNNQAADNTGAGTFRFLGINANNYVDLDGLAEGTTYYYRVATVSNLSEHYRNGTTPTFTNWKYGAVTTGTLASGKKQTYNVTSYGAVAGDGLNDYPAALLAMADANAAGGGIVYFPAGTWDIWPVDTDVTYSGGQLSLANGQSAESTLFQITEDNITFLGDSSGGTPTTLWKLYLWEKRPATEWLQALWASGLNNQYRRYFVFKPYDVNHTTIKNIDVDMGATPVNTGKAWESADAIKYEWDTSHKFWAAHDTTRGKNTIIENVDIRNARGEIIYVGGSSEKILIKDCILKRSNSSTISMSADAEIVDCVISDSANASVESILKSNRNGLDGLPFAQNHIARGCTFIGLDPTGIMKDLPGNKTFSGWHCFNEENTYQTVTDCTFSDFIFSAFGPWYEYRNGLRFNCVFNGVATGYSGSILYTNTAAQSDYGLDGGMSEILWLGDTFNMSSTWTSNQAVMNTFPGAAAYGNESPWTWDAVHFANIGGGLKTLNRLWTDSWGLDSGRMNFVFSNFTKDSTITLSSSYIYNTNPAKKISPTYINFFQ